MGEHGNFRVYFYYISLILSDMNPFSITILRIYYSFKTIFKTIELLISLLNIRF